MVEKIELCAIVCNCLKIIKQTCWTASSDEAVTTGKGYKMSHKYVYLFSEGNGHMRELLGGKGANLAEMTNLGMPVPQGFTITTEACTQYYKDDHQINAEIEAEIMEYVEKLEEMTGKKFGDLYNPLLVSVRSGADGLNFSVRNGKRWNPDAIATIITLTYLYSCVSSRDRSTS